MIMLSREARGQSGPDMLLVKSISCSLPTPSLRGRPSDGAVILLREWGECPALWAGGGQACLEGVVRLRPSRSNSHSDTIHSRRFRISTDANSCSSFALVFSFH